MRIFNLDKNYNVVCAYRNRRNGFKHEAVLHKNGFEVCRAKTLYVNRTWETFEYESVLNKIIGLYFEGKSKRKYLKIIQTRG